ncbi:MAG: hypothetical protein AAB779_04340 [Patescibacteria group bacterium]
MHKLFCTLRNIRAVSFVDARGLNFDNRWCLVGMVLANKLLHSFKTLAIGFYEHGKFFVLRHFFLPAVNGSNAPNINAGG